MGNSRAVGPAAEWKTLDKNENSKLTHGDVEEYRKNRNEINLV